MPGQPTAVDWGTGFFVNSGNGIDDDFGDVGTWNGVPLPGTLALAALPLATLLRRRPTARAALPLA